MLSRAARLAKSAQCFPQIPAYVYFLPKELYEKGANLHFPTLREELAVLTQEQADYVGAKIEG